MRVTHSEEWALSGLFTTASMRNRHEQLHTSLNGRKVVCASPPPAGASSAPQAAIHVKEGDSPDALQGWTFTVLFTGQFGVFDALYIHTIRASLLIRSNNTCTKLL